MASGLFLKILSYSTRFGSISIPRQPRDSSKNFVLLKITPVMITTSSEPLNGGREGRGKALCHTWCPSGCASYVFPGSLNHFTQTRSKQAHEERWMNDATVRKCQVKDVCEKDLSRYRLKLPSLGMFRCADYENSVIRRICPPDLGYTRSLPASL